MKWWLIQWWLIRLTITSASIYAIRQTSIINLERHSYKGVAPPCSNAHPKKKALQSIVISFHRQKVVKALIPLEAERESKEDELRQLNLVLAPMNPKEPFI